MYQLAVLEATGKVARAMNYEVEVEAKQTPQGALGLVFITVTGSKLEYSLSSSPELERSHTEGKNSRRFYGIS